LPGLDLSRSHPLFGRTMAALFLVGISTFLPLYAVQPLLVPIGAEFMRPAAQTAWLMGASSAAIAVCVLPLGAASARLGRSRVMLGGLVVLVAAGVGTVVAQGWPMVLAARALTGVGVAAIIVSAMAWVVEQSHPAAGSAIGGLYISGTSVGGMAGRLISSYVAEFTDWRAGVLVAVLLAAGTGLAAHLLLPGVPPSSTHPAQRVSEPGPVNRRFRFHIYGVAFLGMALFSGVYTAVAYRVAEAPFNAGPAVTGSLFLTYLAGTFTAAISGRLAGRLSIRAMMVAGFVVSAVGVLVTLVANMVAIVGGLLLISAGFFIVHGLANSLAPRYSPQPTAGSARYSLSYYAGSAAGAVVLGAAWDAGGWGLVALFAIVLTGLGAVLAGTARRATPEPPPAGQD
jgi:YNFM family putative membrane transporter